uniref:Uncharacterized protein n=1 Tax=Cyprinus carpio TaxID=7962 RepID=A0A8C2I4Z4_CYPCA
MVTFDTSGIINCASELFQAGPTNAYTTKKNKKKGKTLTLNDFLANDSSGSVPPSYPSTKTTSWADETDDLDGDVLYTRILNRDTERE